MSQGLCPSCGAAVNLTAEQTEDHCAYCRSVVKQPEAEARFAEVKASKAGGALLIADISLRNGEYERALSFYDKATEQDEKSAEAWLGRGICLAHIVAPHEGGQPRIKPTEAVSSWEIAIQFAANPEAMGRRAAKAIAEVVSADSGDWDENVAPKMCHYMLSWALNRDPKGEFLLKAGAKYYSKAAPFVEIKVKSLGSSPSITNFYAEFIANCDKFLKALREINPEAAKECEALFLQFQSLAQERFKKDQEYQESFNELARQYRERIDNAPSPELELLARQAEIEFLERLPADVVLDLSRLESKQEPASSAPPQTESSSNTPTTGKPATTLPAGASDQVAKRCGEAKAFGVALLAKFLNEFRISSPFVKALLVWTCRIFGLFGIVVGIGALCEPSTRSSQRPDELGVGGVVVIFLLFGGLTACGFWPRKKLVSKAADRIQHDNPRPARHG